MQNTKFANLTQITCFTTQDSLQTIFLTRLHY